MKRLIFTGYCALLPIIILIAYTIIIYKSAYWKGREDEEAKKIEQDES